MKRKGNVKLVFAICFLSALLLCPTALFAKPAPKKLVLNHKNLTLYAGETESLQVVSVKPKKASAKVTWKSKKPGIASVSSNGKVTAKKAGKTEIKAISEKNPKVSKSIKITVKKSPKKAEKEIKIKGGIYDPSKVGLGNLKSKLYQLDTYRKKGYTVIRSKEEFQNVAGGASYLSSYAETNFKTNSLVFIKCDLFRAYNECVVGVTTKFDSSGKLRGQVAVQYKRREDKPGYLYPAVMDDYIIVLRLSRKDAAMIDYFECEFEEIKSPEKVEKEFEINGGIYKFSGSLMEWKNTLYELDSYCQNSYVVIPSKGAFQLLAGGVSVLSPYSKTDFEADSLVLVECSLFRACEERIFEFASKFDASGKLCGQVTIQYKRQEDEPGYSYPDVMDDYIIVLRIPKEDAAMIDYFKCKTEKM